MVLEYARNTRDMPISVIRGISYGLAGTGKTFFAGSFPKPLFLSPTSESGVVTLRRVDVAATYLDVNNSTDMLGAMEELASMADKGTLKQRWESVIVDTITLYSDAYVNEILRKGKLTAMRKPDWGLVDSHIRALTELAHGLPMHVWWIALEDYTKDEESGKIISAHPMLYGKRSAKLVASVDIMLHHTVIHGSANQPSVYRAYAKQHGFYEAKDRFGQLPSPMANPTFGALKKAIGI